MAGFIPGTGFAGGQIDLRFGIDNWRSAFAVVQPGREGNISRSPQAVQSLLESAAKQAQPIMMFVRNPGMTQIYSGTINNVQASGEWFNVLDPEVNLHLRSTAIDHGWVVKRPAKDGMITSVEFYNVRGEQVVNFFSRRDRNKEESVIWRDIVASLARAS